MKCPVCTAELPSTAKFCGGCGATLTPPSTPKPDTPPREPAPPAYTPPGNPVRPAYSPSYAGSATPKGEKRYKSLRLIAMLYKILAFVAGGACVLMALFMLVSGIATSSSNTAIGANPLGIFGGVLGGLVLLVYGAFLFIFLYGLGEWMYVFMDIEENTRKTNEMLGLRPPAH
jgi:zinc ribbon protein